MATIAVNHPTIVSLSADRCILIQGRISKGNWGRCFRVRKQGIGCTAEATDTSRSLRHSQASALYQWLKANRPLMLVNSYTSEPEYNALAAGSLFGTEFPGMFVMDQKRKPRPPKTRVVEARGHMFRFQRRPR